MRLLKETCEYCVDSEIEAKEVMEKFRSEAVEKGYILGSCGYTYKEKKSKGEVIGSCYLVRCIKIYGGIWE